MIAPKIYLLNRTTSTGNTLIGIFIGLLLGFVIAALIAIYMSKSPFPFTQKERERAQRQDRVGKPEAGPGSGSSVNPATNTAAKSADKAAADAKGRADPINMATGKDAASAPRDATPVVAAPSKLEASKADPKVEAKADAPKTNELFMLQAGSFQNPADADNQKAKLALIGLEASIEPVDLPDRGTWYRVRLGPYNNLGEVNQVRSQLASGGIDATLLRSRRN